MRTGRAILLGLTAATLSGCGALLEPDTRDVPKVRPVSMAASAPAAPRAAVTPAAMVDRTHVVLRGETLYGVARRYDVKPGELVALNNLPPPYALQVGQTLRVPGQVPAPTLAVASAPQRMPALPMAQGEARAEAAPRAGVTAVALAAPLPPPAAEKPAAGKPSESKPVEARPMAAPSANVGATVAAAPEPNAAWAPPALPAYRPAPSIEPAPIAAPAPAPAAAPLAPAPASEPAGQRPATLASAGTAVPPPPPRSAGGFLFPVQGGRVIASFGPQSGGLSNDGINIAAPRGTPVIAAEHGVVLYAGNELRGFGNMLLIRHADGWLSAYAHLDSMLVTRGAKVARGQQIGTVGMTGSAASPQLHFEIRQGKQPVDPEKQIAQGQATPRTAQLGALPD